MVLVEAVMHHALIIGSQRHAVQTCLQMSCCGVILESGVCVDDIQMENVVGNRHKLHPCIKHERYRGSSQIKFSDGDPDSSRPWKTTNQVQFSAPCCTFRLPVMQ